MAPSSRDIKDDASPSASTPRGLDANTGSPVRMISKASSPSLSSCPSSSASPLHSPKTNGDGPKNEHPPQPERDQAQVRARTDDAALPSSPDSSSLEEALSSLSLDRSETMFRALASIFQASHMHEGNLELEQTTDQGDVWATLQRADELEGLGVRDVASLATVKAVLTRLLASSSRLLLPALRVIADGSRDASWRLPLGDSGILELSIEIIASSNVSDDLQIQSLRLIGNACADTDENRERVVSTQCISKIVERIRNPQVAAVAVPALYNICCDYEPAQIEAVDNGLIPTLIKTIEIGTLDSTPALGYLCRLLDLGSKHSDPANSPPNAVELLLRCATQPGLDVDDSISLVDSAVAHLESEDFQRHMVTHDLFGVPLRYLVRSYFPKASLSGARLPPSTGTSSPVHRDPDEEAELSRVRKALIQALSDVSALPEFAEKHASLSTPLVETLTTWLNAALPQLQLCSCIVLGNLARNDETCKIMVARLGVHKDLIAIVRNSTDTTVVHSALGFLRNLALPPSNKQVLGENGLIDALTRFWVSDFMPQIAHAAVVVARQLVIGNPSNVERLMAPLSSDTESPAHAQSDISLLLSLFDRTDEAAVKLEIARTVAAILRCISAHRSSEAESSSNDLLGRLYSSHRKIGPPLGTMVTQNRYPVVRSEGWFAMALMARDRQGAIIISSVITDVSVFTALEEAISGNATTAEASASPMTDPNTPMSPQRTAAQALEMRAKDRDNAMILVHELLKYRVGLQFSDLYVPLERLLE